MNKAEQLKKEVSGEIMRQGAIHEAVELLEAVWEDLSPYADHTRVLKDETRTRLNQFMGFDDSE